MLSLHRFFSDQTSPLTQLQESLFSDKKLRVYLKRDDLLHPITGGNKWRKLKFNLLQAQAQNAALLVTFGGAYSNHIAAVAAAGKQFGFATLGFIRGEEHLPLNPTLREAAKNGMELRYLTRELYQKKAEPETEKQLLAQFSGQKIYVIPEGGSNALAVKGCAELVEELTVHWDFLCCPAGTGASLAGLIAGADGHGQLLGFPALKGGSFLTEEINNLLQQWPGKEFINWQLQTGYHFGGYAKVKPELLAFLTDFEKKHNITLDPVYTGKMMYGIYELIRQDYFPDNSTIIAWHTGGLQGIAGMKERGLII